jgi:uncharacterized membrane protein
MPKQLSTAHSSANAPSLKSKLAYWVPTALVALMMTAGGLGDALCSAQALEVMHRLGYPDYFTCLLGVAKVLGVAALLLPVPRVLREWAYAGFTFDVLGATVSCLAVGEQPLGALAPLVALGLILSSYRGWKKREAAHEQLAHAGAQAWRESSSAPTTPALIG